jgi:hypothetical protein
MRRALLTSSVTLLAAATMLTGTASAAGKAKNTITLAQIAGTSQTAGKGSVASDTVQGNGALVRQDGKKNLAIIGQRNLNRAIQIGGDTSARTDQANYAELDQRADGDNDARITQLNWNKVTQRECLIAGGPDLNLGVGASVGLGLGVGLLGRNVAVVEQVNAHLGIQRSC